MTAEVRTFLRVAIVALLTAAALVMTVADTFAPWHPWGSYGFDASIDGRITNVYSNMPAARAGLHAGDRVDIAAAPLDVIRSLTAFGEAWPGTTAVFPIRQQDGVLRNVRLTAVPWPRSLGDNITDMIETICAMAFVLIPAWLLLTRPAPLTWLFFIFATNNGFVSALLQELLSPRGALILEGGLAVSVTIGATAFAGFALLFPRLEPGAKQRRVFAALASVALVLVAVQIVQTVLSLTDYAGSISFNTTLTTVANIYAIAIYLLGIGFFVFNYVHAPARDHARMRWVMLGFILAFAGNLTIFVTQGTPAIAVTPPVWAINLLSSLSVLAPVSVAYAILKHHVIDVRFFLSRALVYGLLTTATVAILAFLEWAVARQLEQTNLGIAVEVLAAVLVGIGINRAHSSIDRFVDRFVFRTVHDAEQHFATIGRAMMYARSTRAIDTLVAEESARALHLSGTAVYHVTASGFAQTCSSGSPLREAFDHDDGVVLHLLAERTPLERDGQLAVPFVFRDELIGFALFGTHTNATAIDPNERELLESLCARAASAYDHVLNEERAEENRRLRHELTILQAKYDEAHDLIRRTV